MPLFIGNTSINDNYNYTHLSFDKVSTSGVSTIGIITHPSGANDDYFGHSVAVGSGRIVVGAANANGGESSSLGDDVNGITDAGSALIYDLNGNYVGIITHPSAAIDDAFGQSVAVGSGKIVVGAPYDTTPTNDAGSAHIYDLNGNYVGIITHPSPSVDDYFGWSVSVGSGRIVVGAPNDDVNGITDAGSAVIYDLNRSYVGIITHPNASTFDYFGWSVAAGCGRIVVGAYQDDVNGVANAGSAHIYTLNGSYVGIITHPNATANDYFGTSVAVGSGRIVVGAYADLSAHIYDLNGNYVGIITHPSPSANDYFGWSVSVGSGRIVVGAYGDDIGLSFQDNAGSALIYDLNGNYIGIITHSSPSANDAFGYSVAAGCGRIVIGANSDSVNNLTMGSAHIYKLNENIENYYEEIIDTYKY